MERQLHRGKAAEHDDPRHGQAGEHQSSCVALQARHLARDLQLSLGDQLLRRVDDLQRRGVELLRSGLAVSGQTLKATDTLTKRRRIGKERPIEKLRHRLVALSGSAGTKRVVRTDKLFQCRPRLHLDTDQATPAGLRDVRSPAQAERDGEHGAARDGHPSHEAPERVQRRRVRQRRGDVRRHQRAVRDEIRIETEEKE